MATTTTPSSSFVSKFTPITLLFLFLLSPLPILSLTNNITTLLSSYPDLSDFTNLLVSTTVPLDLTHRTSLTILAVPNSFIRSSTTTTTRPDIADILRYHVLLQYLSLSDLQHFSSHGKLITTLFQTTGRATSNFGSVNVTYNSNTDVTSFVSPESNATLLSIIETVPYNISIFSINNLLVPVSADLMASESGPRIDLNITKAITDGHNFNVAVAMLQASGVVDEFEADENGAGITLFIPTDESFSDLPSNARFQSLPADKKAVVLKFHVLHSYYPLGSLESIVNPAQPTLATEDMGAGSFTLNISRVNGSVSINSGIVQASVTQTVFDQKPVAIFGVSRVLLPREIFGNNPIIFKPSTGGHYAIAQPPVTAVSPATSQVSSPPVFQREVKSEATRMDRCIAGFCCIVLLYVLSH